ncbi:16S rRNA (uracil(1498)-N(3))-methyltransferase [bacterium]|nr:16S rRNA (uracil(1498)-N(3))-methyltransferase [bacterium]
MSRAPFILVEQMTEDGVLKVAKNEVGHLVKVLRAGSGFRITAFDGQGNGWLAEVSTLRGRNNPPTEISALPFENDLICKILETLPAESPGRLRLSVGVGIVKGSRMDGAVEKASELGTETFIPLLTDRTVVKPGAGKVERWRNIALASAKQSRRLQLMGIASPVSLKEFICSSLKNCNNIWVMHNGNGTRHITDLFREIELPIALTVLIGSEGGFSDLEIDCFRNSEIPLVNMGCRPLRTETAVAVSLGTLINFAAGV